MTTQKITERAMLLKVSVHQWPARRNETTARHGASVGMIRTTKDLIPGAPLEEISALSIQIDAAWRLRTLPWLDGGTRILPSALYFDTMRELKALIRQRDAKVAACIGDYDRHRETARVQLNGLFDATDYPPAATLKAAFATDLIVLPIPSSDDFRVPLADDTEANAVRAQLDDMVSEQLAQATRSIWERVYKVVDKMVERLRAYAVDPESGKVLSTFHDSLVENIRDLADLLPGINVTGDPELDMMAGRLRDGLTVYHAKQLRRSDDLRNQVATKAEAILAEVSSLLG